MSRYARRISRPLIAALGLTIAIGAAVYYFKNHKPRTAAAHATIPPVASATPTGSNPLALPTSATPTTKTPEITITPTQKPPAPPTGLFNSSSQNGLVTQTPTANTNISTGSTPSITSNS